MLRLVSAFLLVCSASAWVPSSPSRTATTTSQLQATRNEFLKTVATTTAGVALGGLLKVQPASAETLESGVTYEVVKKGDGPKPEIGELIAIRFAAYNGPVKIDDIFDTPEPYYTRLGSGGLIKGVEQTLPLMRLGDRWKLTIPVRASGVWHLRNILSLLRLLVYLLFFFWHVSHISPSQTSSDSFLAFSGQTRFWRQRSPRLGWQTTHSCQCRDCL